jgi:hypothetical protein
VIVSLFRNAIDASLAIYLMTAASAQLNEWQLSASPSDRLND